MKKKIIHMDYPYGTKLPSKRQLSLDSDVSVITAEHAYALLEEEGYITSKQRSGYYVSYQEGDLFSSMIYPVKEVKIIEQKEEDTFPFSVFAKASRKVLSEYGEEVLRSTESKGNLILRQAIQMYLSRSRDMDTDAEHIIIGAGSEYLYGMIASLFGRSMIYGIEKPSYHSIKQSYRSSGVRIDELQLGENGILSSELERTPASLIHVTPYRSYPTRTSADASKRREYMRWAQQNNKYIVEDDYSSEYSPSVKAEETLFALDERHVIYMNTFTKTISPSIRISYMILPDAVLKRYEKEQSYRTCSVPNYMQLIIAELLNNGSFERHLNRERRKKRIHKKDSV